MTHTELEEIKEKRRREGTINYQPPGDTSLHKERERADKDGVGKK